MPAIVFIGFAVIQILISNFIYGLGHCRRTDRGAINGGYRYGVRKLCQHALDRAAAVLGTLTIGNGRGACARSHREEEVISVSKRSNESAMLGRDLR
jgi:hypothetical protein